MYPLHENVVIELLDETSTTDSGIVLTKSQTNVAKAVIVAVGPDVTHYPTFNLVGATVCVYRNTGTKYDDSNLRLIEYKQILGVHAFKQD